MKIAIVCTYYPFPPSVGGVETIVKNIAIELAKHDHEVHIVTTPLDVTTQRPVTNLGVEERAGVMVHKLKPSNFKIGYARILKGLKDTIAEIKPDIVHVHNLHPHLLQLAKWKKKLGYYKLVVELHHPAVELDFLLQKLLFPFATMALKHVSKEIDVFIAHTQIEKEWLVNRGMEKHKVYVVKMPGIPSKLFEIPSEVNPLHDIVFVGRVVWRKGLHILIKALSNVRSYGLNIKATVAGPANPEYLRKLMNLTQKLELEHVVEFKGYVPENQKYELIKQHKIFVLPSIKDYTPNIIIEAQALGVPVVATKVGAVPEMVIDRETGLLVKPGDADELAKAVVKLLEDDTLRDKISIKARNIARNFTLERIVKKIEDIYRIVKC